MIAVDTSAIVAIFLEEPESATFQDVIADEGMGLFSAMSYLETSMVLGGKNASVQAFAALDRLIAQFRIEIVSFDEGQARAAREAFSIFGRGRHPASLNFGDCAAYALAKTRGIPLLYKGGDFGLTDVIRAEQARLKSPDKA